MKNKIHIKPSKRGTFTKAAKARGKGVQEFASQVLANKDNYSTAMVKKANFAKNASKWKHANGGLLPKYPDGGKLKDEVYGRKRNPDIVLEDRFNLPRTEKGKQYNIPSSVETAYHTAYKNYLAQSGGDKQKLADIYNKLELQEMTPDIMVKKFGTKYETPPSRDSFLLAKTKGGIPYAKRLALETLLFGPDRPTAKEFASKKFGKGMQGPTLDNGGFLNNISQGILSGLGNAILPGIGGVLLPQLGNMITKNKNPFKMYSDGGYLIQYNGPKHENGGIPVNENGKKTNRSNAVAEVEGGEAGLKTKSGVYVFSDNLVNPATGNTFSKDAKRVASKYKGEDRISKNARKKEYAKLQQGNELARMEDGGKIPYGGVEYPIKDRAVTLGKNLAFESAISKQTDKETPKKQSVKSTSNKQQASKTVAEKRSRSIAEEERDTWNRIRQNKQLPYPLTLKGWFDDHDTSHGELINLFFKNRKGADLHNTIRESFDWYDKGGKLPYGGIDYRTEVDNVALGNEVNLGKNLMGSSTSEVAKQTSATTSVSKSQPAKVSTSTAKKQPPVFTGTKQQVSKPVVKEKAPVTTEIPKNAPVKAEASKKYSDEELAAIKSEFPNFDPNEFRRKQQSINPTMSPIEQALFSFLGAKGAMTGTSAAIKVLQRLGKLNENKYSSMLDDYLSTPSATGIKKTMPKKKGKYDELFDFKYGGKLPKAEDGLKLFNNGVVGIPGQRSVSDMLLDMNSTPFAAIPRNNGITGIQGRMSTSDMLMDANRTSAVNYPLDKLGSVSAKYGVLNGKTPLISPLLRGNNTKDGKAPIDLNKDGTDTYYPSNNNSTGSGTLSDSTIGGIMKGVGYGMNLLDALRRPEREKLQLPDFGKGNRLVQGTGMSMEPIRQEINMQANKALDMAKTSAGSFGQYMSRANSILGQSGRSLAQSQLQQKQYNDQIALTKAGRQDQLAQLNQQERIRKQNADSANIAMKQDMIASFYNNLNNLGTEFQKQDYMRKEMQQMDKTQKQAFLVKLAAINSANPNFKIDREKLTKALASDDLDGIVNAITFVQRNGGLIPKLK